MIELQHQDDENNEMDLVDILSILWSRRRLISLVVTILTLSFTLYYYLAPKKYRVEVRVAPIEGVNKKEDNVPDMRYQIFLDYLQSRDMQDKFVETRGLSKEDFGEVRIQSNSRIRKENLIYCLSVNQEKSAGWLNEYVRYVDEYASKTQVAFFEQLLENRRKVIDATRKGRIARIKEALVVARKIEESNDLKKNSFLVSDNAKVIVWGQGAPPLYLLGVRALQAEMENLQNRKNDDAFDSIIRKLIIEISQLKESKRNKTVFLISDARIPNAPVRPKPTIILFGFTIGVILGIVGAIFHAAFQRKRVHVETC